MNNVLYMKYRNLDYNVTNTSCKNSNIIFYIYLLYSTSDFVKKTLSRIIKIKK